MGSHQEEVSDSMPQNKRQRVHGEPEEIVRHPTVAGVTAKCLKAREKIHVVERDYRHYFVVDVGGESGADQFVYQHFNGLCVIGISPSHRAISGGRKVVEVDFGVGRSGDKTANKVSGKKKSGALYLTEHSRVCDLVCNDGSRHKVRSCIRGHLLELNERLSQLPELLDSKAGTEGYIAVVQLKRNEEETMCVSLMTEEQYKQLRNPNIS